MVMRLSLADGERWTGRLIRIFCRLIQRRVEEGEPSLEGMDWSEPEERVGDRSSLLSLQPWMFRNGSSQDEEEKMRVNGQLCDKCHYGLDGFTSTSDEFPPRNVRLSFGRGRGRNSLLRSRRSHRYAVKPVVTSGNCLIPQLFNEDFQIGEYGFDSVSSSASPKVRPFIVTDGNKIISKSIQDPLNTTLENGLCKEVDEASFGPLKTVIEVPPLPPLQRLKRNGGEAQHPELDMSTIRRVRQISSKDSSGGMLILCLGINIGAISSIISNRREVDRLNDKLKHTENLVQDLQEELEMKESLTINELPNETCDDSQEFNGSHANILHSLGPLRTDIPPSFPSEETDEYDCLRSSKSRGNSEFSKIEAELEAELKRLELNMNATSLEGRISAFREIDPEFIGDVVHGELRADVLSRGARGSQVDTNRDSSGTLTTETNNPNYAVSPRELSLRLHEVIQLRLEERIKELERAVQCSPKQVESIEDERELSQSHGSFSNSEKWPSPREESPTPMSQDRDLVEPLCLNLYGDARNAFDEAYEEFLKNPGTRGYVLSPTHTSENMNKDGLSESYEILDHGTGDNSEDKLIDTSCFRTERLWEQMLSRIYSDDDDDESNDTDDEEGKLLIKQIVERTRQGSPVAIHAQRMLFELEE